MRWDETREILYKMIKMKMSYQDHIYILYIYENEIDTMMDGDAPHRMRYEMAAR